MEYTKSGVCAPKGFLANGIHCGIRKNKEKLDLSLIFSDREAAAAAVYTQNLVKGAPILLTMENLKNGRARAVICNSGNANTCNSDGALVARAMCETTALNLGIDSKDVIVASTGVIGQPLNPEPIKMGLPQLVEGLGNTAEHATSAALGIMTTDTIIKQAEVRFEIDGKECFVGGMAKGSGMIHPNMATMLCFITCDIAITPEMLRKALIEDIADSFNMLSIDGDTSTNDMVSIMANGAAGNKEIVTYGDDFDIFASALQKVTTRLCRLIAKDGEGASKKLECAVKNAPDKSVARAAAKAVISSSLVKAAIGGEDANWGRVLCALGYSGAELDVNKIDVSFVSSAGFVKLCMDGRGIPFSEEEAAKVLAEDEILIDVDLKDGLCEARAYGCDLTCDYVRINGSYRT